MHRCVPAVVRSAAPTTRARPAIRTGWLRSGPRTGLASNPTASIGIGWKTDPDVASEFARDSPLEGDGFELPVPREKKSRNLGIPLEFSGRSSLPTTYPGVSAQARQGPPS